MVLPWVFPAFVLWKMWKMLEDRMENYEFHVAHMRYPSLDTELRRSMMAQERANLVLQPETFS